MDDFTCSICLQPFADPVRLVTGHVYCRQCIAAWFRMRPAPPTCPLSNIPLAATDLLPAPDVTARARQWAALHEPESVSAFERPQAAVVFVEPPPPPPPPRGPPPSAPTPDRSATIAAIAWSVLHVFTTLVSIGVSGSTAFDDRLPLHNLGRAYPTQPWRMVTCLFTDASPLQMCIHGVAQALLVKRLVRVSTLAPEGTLLVLLSCATTGSFSAGVAFPDDVFSGGGTSTSVLAFASIVHSLHQRQVNQGFYLAIGAFLVSASLVYARHAEVLSHAVGSVAYALLHLAGHSRFRVSSTLAYAALNSVLVGLFAGHASAPWLKGVATLGG
jgi:hypothetical protein